MLRSRHHQPWQPRMSGNDLFNPFSHSAEQDNTLDIAEEVRELEDQPPASEQNATQTEASIGLEADRPDSSSTEAAASDTPASHWYSRLLGKFTRH
jgi:hypothetical protein